MPTYTGTPADDDFHGTGDNDIFLDISEGDDVDGRGGSDVISLDFSATHHWVWYDAVAAATADGTSPFKDTHIRSVERLDDLKTGSGHDLLNISVDQGPFTWDAGGGYDTLTIDFSHATDGVFSGEDDTGFYIHANQWADADFDVLYDVESVAITGSRFHDVLTGGDGSDILNGGDGDDTLDPAGGKNNWVDGGKGFDTLDLDRSDSHKKITYDATDARTSNGTWASDTYVRNVEGIGTLKTGSGDDKLIVDSTTNAFTWWAGDGDDLLDANYSHAATGIEVIASTTAGGDALTRITGGGLGAAAEAYTIELLRILGTRFDDVIYGTRGDDRLDGNRGADDLYGGLGNDTYLVDNAGDTITELTGQGTDTVYASVNWTLGANLENLRISSAEGRVATGNELNNALTGNAGDDVLKGMDGNDLMNGQDGADRMYGGTGNDTYIVDDSHDAVHELDGEGTDRVIANVDFSLHGAFVEDLYLGSWHDIDGTGNSLDNGLFGNNGDNSLYGEAGNDQLNGGRGDDDLYGGAGNDSYIVDSEDDRAIEHDGEGTDTVYASVDFELSGSYLENLVLTGHADVHAFGNDLDNRIYGNDGDNRIVGYRGDDTLTGNGGRDTFAFAAGSGHDRIIDFDASEGDRIDLHAYHAGDTAVISQHGADAWIDLGGGNVVAVLNTSATSTAFLDHIIW